LPVKFGIDKRKAHLSTLICSGQITRVDALKELEKPVYDTGLLMSDKEFVLKKLGLTPAQFEKYLDSPRREHTEFKHEKGIWDDIPILRPFRPAWKLVKKFRKK
jgi:hypothetical protein